MMFMIWILNTHKPKSVVILITVKTHTQLPLSLKLFSTEPEKCHSISLLFYNIHVYRYLTLMAQDIYVCCEKTLKTNIKNCLLEEEKHILWCLCQFRCRLKAERQSVKGKKKSFSEHQHIMAISTGTASICLRLNLLSTSFSIKFRPWYWYGIELVATIIFITLASFNQSFHFKFIH